MKVVKENHGNTRTGRQNGIKETENKEEKEKKEEKENKEMKEEKKS